MKCTDKERETCEYEKRGCTGCYYVESKELFEELGYKEETYFFDKRIIVSAYSKSDIVVRFYKNKTFDVTGTKVDIALLRAINRKCEELGWL